MLDTEISTRRVEPTYTSRPSHSTFKPFINSPDKTRTHANEILISVFRIWSSGWAFDRWLYGSERDRELLRWFRPIRARSLRIAGDEFDRSLILPRTLPRVAYLTYVSSIFDLLSIFTSHAMFAPLLRSWRNCWGKLVDVRMP